MKTLIVFFGAAALLVPAPAKRTFTGIVTDKMCGAMNVKPDAKCVRECVKAGSQWALVEGGNVYVLSNAKAADAFAGQKVKVSGRLDAKTNTIQVDAITPAAAR
jgi:streptogramin lyase